jgi:metacaspase-1
MANHAVLIGVNEYEKQPPLYGCVNDVVDFKSHLQKTGSVSDPNIVVLTDAAASKKSILEALRSLVSALGVDDTGYFHMSSHGVRMPSADAEEPDGLDEVLCPYEFDWTAETGISDNEVLEILAGLDLGARLVVTVDACHSGHLRRVAVQPGSRARTLTPPDAVRARMANRRASMRGFRAAGDAPNVVFASACLPWQTAADTAFDGRENGAFSYHFLKHSTHVPDATIAEIVTAVEPDLTRFEMTPVVEGASGLKYASERRLPGTPRSPRSLQQPSPKRAGAVVFDQSWTANLFGQDLGLDLKIVASTGGLVGHPTVRTFGTTLLVPPFRIDGNTLVPVELGYLGARVVIAVSGWVLDSSSIRFDLNIDLTANLPFVPRVRIAQVPVWLPVTVFDRAALQTPVSSPAELLAVLTLQQMQTATGSHAGPTVSREPVILRGRRDPWLQVFAAGVTAWGPNWREDRIIRPFADRPRMDGIRRHSIEIGPQRGKGNVYSVGWLSEQESDFDFILHIGNGFFDGWGDIDWRVVGYNADIDPFPRDVPTDRPRSERIEYQAAPPQPHVNGRHNGIALTQP